MDVPNSGIIAIDGRCGSGKTTLANALSEKLACPVVHMDHFFLPREMQTAENLARGNVDFVRFQEEVLSHLGEEFSYRVWNCKEQALGKRITIPKARHVIVEGSFSLHPDFGRYFDYGIFLTVSKDEQIKRLTEREGDVSVFLSRWIPLEEAYFAKYSVKDRADIVIDG